MIGNGFIMKKMNASQIIKTKYYGWNGFRLISVDRLRTYKLNKTTYRVEKMPESLNNFVEVNHFCDLNSNAK